MPGVWRRRHGNGPCADTRKLKGSAKVLYAGAKQTRNGIEILTRDKDAAVVNLARYLGMMVDKELSGPGGGPIPMASLTAEDLTVVSACRVAQGGRCYRLKREAAAELLRRREARRQLAAYIRYTSPKYKQSGFSAIVAPPSTCSLMTCWRAAGLSSFFRPRPARQVGDC